MNKELKYWEHKYEMLKELYNIEVENLKSNPSPWQKTRVKNLEIEYLEANDRYFTLLEA